MQILAFLDDIKNVNNDTNKHLSAYVLVTIGNMVTEVVEESELGTCVYGDPSNPRERESSFQACMNQYQGLSWTPYVEAGVVETGTIYHRISTQKVKLGGNYYKPILLNIPSISES